jgi:hypothetical protein
VVLLVAAFGDAAAARAAAPRPGASSVDQYVELIPTATGPKAPGVEKERRLSLSPEAMRALDGVSNTTAVALSNVATSSTYGAPSRLGSGASGRIVRDTRTTVRSPSGNQSVGAIAAAVAPAGDTRMIALLLTLAAVTVAAAALSLRRHL